MMGSKKKLYVSGISCCCQKASMLARKSRESSKLPKGQGKLYLCILVFQGKKEYYLMSKPGNL